MIAIATNRPVRTDEEQSCIDAAGAHVMEILRFESWCLATSLPCVSSTLFSDRSLSSSPHSASPRKKSLDRQKSMTFCSARCISRGNGGNLQPQSASEW